MAKRFEDNRLGMPFLEAGFPVSVAAELFAGDLGC